VLRGGRVTTVLIGASRVEQIDDNVATVNRLDFTEEELQRIEEILRG
jgi:L-glyceraldehyde 3-phosphate reductase